MDLSYLKDLINTLQSLGVRSYKNSIDGLELVLDPLNQPTSLMPKDPEEQRTSILKQMKDLQKEEEELEAWST